MPFGWFSGRRNESGSLFREFKKEIEQLERVEQIIGEILEDNKVDEQAVREEMVRLFENLEKKFAVFYNLVKKNRKKLQSMILTSLSQTDYLSLIEKINEGIMTALWSVDKHIHKKDFMAFMQDVWDSKIELDKKLKTLEKSMTLFLAQSRESLEWRYRPGIRHIDMKDFLKCVQMLGGKIDKGHGKGAHFEVKFRLFKGFMGERARSEKKIDQVRMRDFVENARSRIEQHLDPKYLLCFFIHGNAHYRKLFVAKYGRLFRL